jgi:hypothetical protein
MKIGNNVLVNAVNINSGGGLTILLELYRNSDDNVFFLVGNEDLIPKSDLSDNKVILLPKVFTFPFFAFLLNLIFINYWVLTLKATTLVSLGNFASITWVKQKVYIQWAYFVYGVFYLDNSLHLTSITRLLRYFKILFFVNFSDEIIVQTHVIKNKMLERHPCLSRKSISVLYPGVNHADLFNNNNASFSRTDKTIKEIIYPALYYNHKNFELLAQINSYTDLGFKLYLTLSDAKFRELKFNLIDGVENLGILGPGSALQAVKGCDAVLMPSKFETVGLPFLEALTYRKDILCSNTDFANEICGKAAKYFEPNSVASLENVLSSYYRGENIEVEYKIEEFNKFPTWDEMTKKLLGNNDETDTSRYG